MTSNLGTLKKLGLTSSHRLFGEVFQGLRMIFVLKIIKKNKINLSNDFLESLLVKWLPKGIPNDSGTIEKIAIRNNCQSTKFRANKDII